jgi:thiamine biosynthesis lipoprotein
MGSRCEVRIAAADEHAARRLATYAIDEVHRIEHKYSRYLRDSVVSRINASAGRYEVECDKETLALLAYADTLHAASDGRFDITSGVLRKAGISSAVLPQPQALQDLLPLVGWRQMERDKAAVFLPRAGMELDFGGFGKEYAADRAAEALAEQR